MPSAFDQLALAAIRAVDDVMAEPVRVESFRAVSNDPNARPGVDPARSAFETVAIFGAPSDLTGVSQRGTTSSALGKGYVGPIPQAVFSRPLPWPIRKGDRVVRNYGTAAQATYTVFQIYPHDFGQVRVDLAES